MFVCHSTAIAARWCDVGLDKVSHQQYSQAGGCRVRVIQRRAVQCCSWTGAGISHTHTQLSVIDSQRLGGQPGAQALESATVPRQPRQGGCTPSRAIAHGVAQRTRDVPLLGASQGKVPTSLYFLQPAGQRVFFVWRARTSS